MADMSSFNDKLAKKENGRFASFSEREKQRENKTDGYSKVSLDVKTDLNERLNRLAKIYPRGFKTNAVNEALEALIEDLEAMNSKQLEDLERAEKSEAKARNRK